MRRFDAQRLNPFMAHKTPRVSQAGLDVLAFQPRISLQKFIGGRACCQHPQDMFDRQPPTPDDRFPTKYLGIDRDAFQKFLFVHLLPRVVKVLTGLILPRHINWCVSKLSTQASAGSPSLTLGLWNSKRTVDGDPAVTVTSK